MADSPKLHILLYGLNFEPELTGIGKYSGEMARWLVARGHSLQVVTAPPYYPEWHIKTGFSATNYRASRSGNLAILRCPIWVPGKVTGLSRLLHLLSFACSSAPALIWSGVRRQPSVLMVVVPTMVCAPLALLVGRLLRLPVWLHVQDFEVDAMHSMGIVPSASFAHRVAVGLESWLLKRFDRVSSISRKMVDRLLEKGVQRDRAVEFPNWVDVSAIHPQAAECREHNAVRALFDVPACATVVLYAGNMGLKQGIDVVIEAARLLAGRADIFFIFVGAGSAVEDLKQSAQNLAQIRWFSLQPLELLNDLLNAGDIHVLPQRADAADLVMPSKLTGMLSSGRPVVGTAEADTELGMVLDKCGIRVPSEDAGALAAAIDRLSLDEGMRRQLGSAGREYALKHLSHTAILQLFESELGKLVAQEASVMPGKSCEK